ncbi:MAG: helix-turn-helix transcriptional regulator [Tepidisphaeraceae bacterium]
MKSSKKKRIEAAGFTIGTVQEFLRLSDGEMALIDLKVRLVEMLKRVRTASGITQQALAKKLGSSQSRVAKIEAGGADVSLDLICKALFALGVSRRALGKVIASKRAA